MPRKLVGGDVDDALRVAVVRAVHGDHASLARVRARDAQRQVVRLGAGVYPEHHLGRGNNVTDKRYYLSE